MLLDSNTIEILWEYAETNRAYKDYRKAELYYKKVYSREDTKIFPASLLQLGLMQKQNGKYDEAIETFKLGKKKYAKDKKGFSDSMNMITFTREEVMTKTSEYKSEYKSELNGI